jgi:AcrR family transcriptional regulator
MPRIQQALGGQARGSSGSAAGVRDRILDVALGLLADKGFAGVTLRTIGSRVGLHNSSLFHHFRGKREIVGAVLARVNEGLLQRLEPLAGDDPPSLERFIAVLQELSDHYAANRAEARCALRVILDPDEFLDGYVARIDPERPDPANRVVRFTTLLWGWLARAQAAGVIRPVHVSQAARNVLGVLLLEPAWTAGKRPQDRSDERRRAELAAFVRGALAPRPERS